MMSSCPLVCLYSRPLVLLSSRPPLPLYLIVVVQEVPHGQDPAELLPDRLIESPANPLGAWLGPLLLPIVLAPQIPPSLVHLSIPVGQRIDLLPQPDVEPPHKGAILDHRLMATVLPLA